MSECVLYGDGPGSGHLRCGPRLHDVGRLQPSWPRAAGGSLTPTHVGTGGAFHARGSERDYGRNKEEHRAATALEGRPR
eukprot:13683225-Alexandrium_andersonii.AAC.1